MEKTAYFEERISSKHFYDTEGTLTAIANRFIGENPAASYGFCAYSKKEFGCIPKSKKLRADEHNVDLDKIYPEAQVGQIVYVYAKVYSLKGGKQLRAINPTGKCEIYINGKLQRRTTAQEEVKVNRTLFYFELESGWNDVIIRCEKTHLGFGFLLSYASDTYSPFRDYEGQFGFLYSELCPIGHRYPEGGLPTCNMNSAEDLLEWFPKNRWERKEGTAFSRIFRSGRAGEWFVAKSKICVITGGVAPLFFGKAYSPTKICIDGKIVYSTDKNDAISFQIELHSGEHSVVVLTQKDDSTEWGAEIQCTNELKNPCGLVGYEWIYAGGFEAITQQLLNEFENLSHLLNTSDGKDYWHLDAPDMMVRPCQTDLLFGRWNYPLGVTLLGIYKAGVYLKNSTLTEYAKGHIKLCSDFYEYVLWDREQYGHTLLLDLISSPQCLDDCGSMGSTTLAVDSTSQNTRRVADAIKRLMDNRIARTAEHNFYRAEEHETIWADDMYMCLPFLARYYAMTSDEQVLEEIADQISGFKHYLYLENKHYLGHVYSVTRKKLSEVPWSRGNGWCIFSLSEVLERMPGDHPRRMEVMKFFVELSEGYLKLQNEHGMWHQVLDVPESFEESSGTAMMVYAFARAVRFGWVNGELKQRLAESAFRGWEALRSRCVDLKGNVYGVCCGSGFGFSTDYYARELRPVINDTHGVGIVLLAGVETSLMLNSIE